MKKKIIISILGCLILVIGIIGFIFWNNRTISTIYLDINPSIEIKISNSEDVVSITALNDDANDVISNDLVGKKSKKL